ncbi:SixA phosphatase family protein [Nocardioides insulae]|uniref:SixA phosphatase family protein n=1 Tax=Nocardioides insulae TaxID=394734 RepID=UPI00041B1D0A|nr:histidine phosphatase family protein [Nocardioides insulae]
MTGSRSLVVLRHAKAMPEAASDAERPLAPRGLRDAEATGVWFAERSFTPDLALVSSAVRTRQTYEQVSAAAGWSLAGESRPELYGAGPEDVVGLLHAVPDEVTAVLVVGHNPTMAELAQLLDDGSGPEDVRRHVRAGFPTCASARFELSGTWLELEFGTARLADHHRP